MAGQDPGPAARVGDGALAEVVVCQVVHGAPDRFVVEIQCAALEQRECREGRLSGRGLLSGREAAVLSLEADDLLKRFPLHDALYAFLLADCVALRQGRRPDIANVVTGRVRHHQHGGCQALTNFRQSPPQNHESWRW
ncbi:MAG: hypothetical protein WBM50_20540 [Acidimicrobiales bacterium]